VGRQGKALVWIIIAVLSVAVVVWAWQAKTRKANKPTMVTTRQLQRTELVEYISAPGQTDPRLNVQISAKVSARILELPYKEGDRVTKGDQTADPPVPASILVRLDSKDLESRLNSAKARYAAQAAQIEVEKARIAAQKESLRGLRAALDQAEKDLRRQEELLKSHDVSQSTYDQAKLRYDDAKAQYESQEHALKASELNLLVLQHNLEMAQAEIDQADEALSHTVIRSPIDGVVTRLNAAVGELVVTGTMNNPGTVIMEVADLSEILVLAQVAEADIGKIRLGQRAKIHIQAYPDNEWTGQVVEIALTKNDLPRRVPSLIGGDYFRVEILLDPDPNGPVLYAGLRCQVEIETLKHKDVITVPSQAVLARPVDELPPEIRSKPQVQKDKTFTAVVYRYIDGKAIVTPVEIGAGNLTETIIRSGLSEQDRVIVGPYRILDRLAHNQPVRDEAETTTTRAKGNKGSNAYAR
jgi:HlyD family secretion protein